MQQRAQQRAEQAAAAAAERRAAERDRRERDQRVLRRRLSAWVELHQRGERDAGDRGEQAAERVGDDARGGDVDAGANAVASLPPTA